jgi:hypothetical protein
VNARRRNSTSQHSIAILHKADYTVSTGEHNDANGVRLSKGRGDCIDIAHSDSEGFFFCNNLNRV